MNASRFQTTATRATRMTGGTPGVRVKPRAFSAVAMPGSADELCFQVDTWIVLGCDAAQGGHRAEGSLPEVHAT